jgi:CHAT domain-containing protein
VTTAKTSDATKPDGMSVALRAVRAIGDDACGERSGLERLRGSAREADAIAALAPDGQKLEATGFDANLDLATSGELGKYKVVHFATHGYVPAGAPELSGLVLSLVDEKGRERPGYLGMPQIYAMRLPVETVVLSACETGLGREVSGEGVIGLVRGFMYAGSSRVVSSLWKIDDEETAVLMAELYAGMLKRGRTPAAALREAQLKMIKDGKSPYVWGAFQLAGEWR